MARKKQNQVGNGQNQGITTPQTAIDAFNDFLDSFINKASYVLKSKKEIFKKKDDVKNTFEVFCENSKDEKKKDKNFNDVVEDLRKNKNFQDIYFDILNHAIWLWALPNARKTSWALKDAQNRYNDKLLQVKGVAGGGSGYVQMKTNGVRFILYLFTQIHQIQGKTEAEMRRAIIEACQKIDYTLKAKTFTVTEKVPDGVKNLLLYLCKPDFYQPIASTADKEKIVKAFWEKLEMPGGYLPPDERIALANLDYTLKTIRENVFKKKSGVDFSFYEGLRLLLWKGESVTDLSLAQQLEYKKAMILYGPPGTSKTYTARELAKEIIFRHVIHNTDKKTAIALLNDKDNSDLEKRINYLQFHININYEDLIAGQTIKGNDVITQKGFIYEVIEKAKQEFTINQKTIIKDAPYVVILDEINRTDISRVFGELFTAIEKRGINVDLLLPDPDKTNEKLKLNIPENVYFIGTMNEIDFSLERVDFALRRRFIWELHDYDENTLESMMLHKLNICSWDYNEADFNDYCNACTKLNTEVESVMGEAYHIGHTFFAEIVDIYNELKTNKTTAKKPWDKAKTILWHISIKPTLEAYCGTMEKAEREKYLSQKDGSFYKAFFK